VTGADGAAAGVQLSLDSSGALARGAGSESGGLRLGSRASIERAGSAGDAEWGADGRMVALGTDDLNIPFSDLKFIRSIGAGAPNYQEWGGGSVVLRTQT